MHWQSVASHSFWLACSLWAISFPHMTICKWLSDIFLNKWFPYGKSLMFEVVQCLHEASSLVKPNLDHSGVQGIPVTHQNQLALSCRYWGTTKGSKLSVISAVTVFIINGITACISKYFRHLRFVAELELLSVFLKLLRSCPLRSWAVVLG